MRLNPDRAALGKFFSAYTEHAFIGELGVTDTRLIDYVSGLLGRFVRPEPIEPSASQDERPGDLLTLLERAEHDASDAGERRELFRHIGDFTLFWSGVFPESLGRRRPWDTHRVGQYQEHGKRSYFVASTYCDSPEHADQAPVLRRLSEDFELCAAGLHRARLLWEEDQPKPEDA